MSSSQEDTCLLLAESQAEIDSEEGGSSSGEQERLGHKRLGTLLLGYGADPDNLLTGSGSGGKKRRKQSTPVKFSTSLSTGEDDESEDDQQQKQRHRHGDYHHEGKQRQQLQQQQQQQQQQQMQVQQQQQQQKSLQASSLKDENLNNEFRCQYCSRFFDDRDSLEMHLECEHDFADVRLLQRSSREDNEDDDNIDDDNDDDDEEQQRRPQPNSPGIQSEEAAEVGPAEAMALTSEQSVSPMNLSHISVRNFASSSWLPPTTNRVTSPSDATTAFFKAAAAAVVPNAAAASSRGNHHYTASMPAVFPAGPFGQFMSMPGFMSDPSQFAQQRAAQLSKYPKIFNPDAYCELCNKEFCNKYFLKTHKANKHNVYSDQSHSNDGLTTTTTTMSPSFVVSSSSPINKLVGSNQTALRLETNGLQTTQGLPCDLCSKQFKNEESLRKHRNKVHFNRDMMMLQQQQHQQQQTSSGGEDEGQSPGIMETLFKQEFSIDEAEITFKHVEKSSSVNGDKQQQQQQQRLFLVMNPEAFCDLCCKEFLDRHQLQTHKLKRHGIMSDKSQNSSVGTDATMVQTSPLNLIMADSLVGNGSTMADIDEDDFACKLCGLRLQTQELFLLHVEKIHRDRLSPKNVLLDDDSVENPKHEDMISEDLKKLQTMISQLSGLESNKAASCALCGKDYDNPAALRSHMIAEHSVVPENLASHVGLPLTTTPQLQQQQQQQRDSKRESLSHFGGKVEERQSTTPTSSTTPQLTQAPISPMTPKSNSSQSMQSENRPKSTTATTTPSGNIAQINSSFCTLCNKELCNKYFMKTHMQKMHGIEIENGAQIGGVVCNICKKELCSKYFLRVHKQNTHGITEDGQPTTTTTTAATTAASNKQDTMESPGATSQEDLALKPELLGDLNLRYITHFTEVCPICNRRFRSSKWLKLHLKEHGPPELDKWREMEQQSQKTPNKSSKSSSASSYSAATSLPSLKIPNGGFESTNNSSSSFMRADLAALGNQVLSNFFGSSQSDNQQQQQGQQQTYCCSQPQCNFSTTILPLYFLHERSHHQEIDEQRMLQCPICAQNFGQLEALREHVSARHPNPFPGLLSQLPLPLLGDFAMPPNSCSEQQQQQQQQQQRGATIKSESNFDVAAIKDCPRTSPSSATPQHIMNEIDTNQMIKQEDSAAVNNVVQVMPQGAYKCSQCGFASANLNRIKKHVRKDHRCPGGADPVEQALAELNKMLKDVANKHKVPVSYAVPQQPPQQQDSNSHGSDAGKTVMQAFIVEEKPQEKPQRRSNGSSNGCDNEEDDDDDGGGGNYRAKRFAPALVFLPVKARVSDSLTLTFSLSPA